MRKFAALLLLCGLLSGGLALAQSAWAVDWWVVAGGGQPLAGAGYTLNSTAGQPLTAQSSGDTFTVQSGFWQNWPLYYPLYLPYIRR